MRFPIGASTFRDVIESGDSYIDKTLFVQEVFEDPSRATLLLRPRRFGKTLNMSMLQHFLSDEVGGQRTSHLFKGLKIASTVQVKEQGEHIVLSITFKDMKKDTYLGSLERFRGLMSAIYDKHYYLLDGEQMKPHHDNKFQSILNKTSSLEDLESSLYDLTGYLERHHKKKVWLLMDEYDAPLLTAYEHGYYEQMCDFMRGCMSPLVKDNPYLHKAVITGILRISKESLFSGMNNLKVCSMLDDKYAEHFGFTQDEVDDILEKSDLASAAQDVRDWYNGYHIGGVTLYNPWSISQYVDSGGKFDLYWVNTAEDALLRQMIISSSNEFKEKFEVLLSGGKIIESIDLNVTFKNIIGSSSAVWSLLYLSGHLKVLNVELVMGRNKVTFELANMEIKLLFYNIISSWLGKDQAQDNFENFIHDLLRGDVDAFKLGLVDIMNQVASCHDTARVPECFYHGLMMGMIAYLYAHKDYKLSSNRESSKGRFDYMILSHDLSKLSILFEFKRLNTDLISKNKMTDHEIEDMLKSESKAALKQIHDKSYITELAAHGARRVLIVGLAFCGKNFEMRSETVDIRCSGK